MLSEEILPLSVIVRLGFDFVKLELHYCVLAR